MTDNDLAASNSLADLAARIRTEHRAAAASLSDAMRHAMTAGELLIEAKTLVKHGQWLPWLSDHVSISERTAQLYMRVARNRAEIEAAKSATAIADLTLNEAAALLMLSSDVRKLMAFMRETENLEGEELVKVCIDANVALYITPNYDPFANRSDDERREWKLFTLWLAKGTAEPWRQVEWLLQRPFQNVAEWLGEEGDRCRVRWGMRRMPEALKKDWSSFTAEHRTLNEAEIEAEFEAAQNAAPVPTRKRRRGTRR
jgi:Protein of unknown function (DUF3102)